MRRFSFFFITLILFGWTTSLAQQKATLDHDVYDDWKSIADRAISMDGQWILYAITPQEGDAVLEVRRANGSQFYTADRGRDATFSAGSDFVVFTQKAIADSLKEARRAKKRPADQPKDGLGILRLSDGDMTIIERVKSFQMPEKASGWVAYLMEPALDDGKEEKAEEEQEEGAENEETAEKKKPSKNKQAGTELVLRNLTTGAETRYADVMDYTFTENGNWLVFTTSSKDGSHDGVFAVQPAAGTMTTVMADEGDYKQLAVNEGGTHVAFLTNRDDYAAEKPAFSLYYAAIGQAPRALQADAVSGLMAEGHISENGRVYFSKNGERVFFGTAPKPLPDPEKVPDDEKVSVDIWNWKDPLLQPMQLVQVQNEKRRTYLAVVHVNNGRAIQLAHADMPNVFVGMNGDADVAVANANMPYRQEISWDFPRFNDVYLLDVNTGNRRLIREQLKGTAQLSAEANYVIWWDHEAQGHFVQSVSGGTPVNVSAAVPYPVYNELHDSPYEAFSYGWAGWTDGDRRLLLYDRYDIWSVDPTGRQAAVCVTDGFGRANDMRLRYARLDPELRNVPTDEDIMLSAFHLYTKASGFYRDRVSGNNAPSEVIMADASFSPPRKAQNANTLMWSRSTFAEFPDVWTSDLNFDNPRKHSHANPQQDDYLWGTAELASWRSIEGTPLQGIVVKPENFDPNKKYPMMVYFYERMSDGLHRYVAPGPARSSINFAFYASRGYVVFIPDVPYQDGYPGESALDAIVPGVLHMIDQGYVDAERVGVQGHSWGGYQIAYMVTRTNIFKAAEAGAPVSNMTSAYGGIRWASGMSRMFQYERTQSRIGGTLWEQPLHYIENSPLFWAYKVETPILMMHNDEDGAVPWYQGIEFFVALRRLNKPVWMLNYNGEAHGLRQRKNQKDWAIRMQQFFDYYLQDAPAPVWLEEGVPALKKGHTLGLELMQPNASGAITSSDQQRK